MRHFAVVLLVAPVMLVAVSSQVAEVAAGQTAFREKSPDEAADLPMNVLAEAQTKETAGEKQKDSAQRNPTEQGPVILTPEKLHHTDFEAAPRRHATPDPTLGRELEPHHYWRMDFSVGADYLSSYYYRGFVRETEGAIVQPWADLNLNIFNNPTSGLLHSVDLRVGLRTSHHWKHTVRGPGERWVELNWYGGAALGVFDRWEVEALYINREDVRTNFRDVHQVNLTLRFDDSDPDYDWSLGPYATLTMEFENHSDAGWISLDARNERGRFNYDKWYLELGVRPEFELFELYHGEPMTLSVPARVGMSLNDYYTDTAGRDRTFGFAEAGLTASLPLARFDAEPGRRFLWSLDAGVYLLYLGNSARDISDALGQGDGKWRAVGKVGLKMDY